MIQEVQELCSRIRLGDLTARADVDNYEGAARQIVDGINAMLDAVVNPLNVTSDYVRRISSGDLPPKITETYYGEFNAIKENLNTCIDTLTGLVDEMGHMSQEHNLGDIDVMIPADKFQGAYRTMAKGINEMVSGHIAVKKKAMACIAEFSKGNFEAPLDRFPGKKAFINDNIELLRTNLKALIVDANILSEAAVAGKLATRADASKHEGDFARIVKGVNDTLDAVIGPLNVSADYVDRISKGDIPPKITDNYNGDFNTIKNNLNQCIDALSGLVDEMAHMSDQHNLGDIDVEIPAERFHGAYRTMAKGTNEMVAGHISVKKKAMACIAEFSRGNFEAPLEKFPGKKAFINENIELLRTNLKALIADANMLSEAAVAGKLGTRADATKHHGDFGRIVKGVNDTLDAVIGPLNVAADYVAQIGEGHIPPKITDSYNGDFNAIKNNLNATLDGIAETTAAAQRIADGDLTVEVKVRSERDVLSKSITAMVVNLTRFAAEVQSVADQVAAGSNEVNTSAQSLAQGATEQASSIEEVSSSMEEMSSMVKQNAENAQQTTAIALKAATDAQEGGR
ncbi:MAG TPA: HAMP domain-containing protein, partial [Fimbriimonadaceae bacterium]|nr:HAMP domain-containing protein [Fimbriimonadaceae bacterium]